MTSGSILVPKMRKEHGASERFTTWWAFSAPAGQHAASPGWSRWGPSSSITVASPEMTFRCFRAATELGLTTVAVYTYEDRFSLHRFKADESYPIGPAAGGAPVKGYLDIPALIAVAKEHEADAIHPGYGFLSENAELARSCAENGITFVGPTAELLETFGDKTAAKRLAKKANVPTVPGSEHGLIDPAKVKAAAKQIGYPVILKASFGGGGRGM